MLPERLTRVKAAAQEHLLLLLPLSHNLSNTGSDRRLPLYAGATCSLETLPGAAAVGIAVTLPVTVNITTGNITT